MKVKELIEELKKHDPEAEVSTEGCDCFGDVASVSEDPQDQDGNDYSKKVVTLYRS